MREFLDPEQSSEKRELRRAQAFCDYPEVAKDALAAGLLLTCRSESHYQLMPPDKAWILNLYPGNCRLYSDKNTRIKAPYLNFAGHKWSLRDVVKTVTINRDKTRKDEP